MAVSTRLDQRHLNQLIEIKTVNQNINAQVRSLLCEYHDIVIRTDWKEQIAVLIMKLWLKLLLGVWNVGVGSCTRRERNDVSTPLLVCEMFAHS